MSRYCYERDCKSVIPGSMWCAWQRPNANGHEEKEEIRHCRYVPPFVTSTQKSVIFQTHSKMFNFFTQIKQLFTGGGVHMGDELAELCKTNLS